MSRQNLNSNTTQVALFLLHLYTNVFFGTTLLACAEPSKPEELKAGELFLENAFVLTLLGLFKLCNAYGLPERNSTKCLISLGTAAGLALHATSGFGAIRSVNSDCFISETDQMAVLFMYTTSALLIVAHDLQQVIANLPNWQQQAAGPQGEGGAARAAG